MMSFEEHRQCVGVGWHPLLNTLHHEISEIVPDYQIAQVKEKFGGLRYYVALLENVSDEDRRKVYELIDKAESDADTICEDCGNDGVNRSVGGWYRTLCEKCHALHQARRAERLGKLMESSE